MAPVAPVARLAAPLGPVGPGSFNVALPDVPAPTRPIAAVFGGALDPLLVAELPELVALTPQPLDEQPYDLRAVTVESTFDAASLIASLRRDPGRADLQRIPDVWWQNIVEVIDVEVVRREVRGDGSAGEEIVVPPLPGRISLRSRFDAIESLRDLQGVALTARDNARSILRPRFYNMIAGEPWMPPSMAEQQGQQDSVIAQQRRTRQNIERQIAEEQRRLDALGRPGGGARSSADPGDRLRGVTAGISRPGGAPAPSRPSNQPSRGDNIQQQRENITKRIADLRTQLAQLRQVRQVARGDLEFARGQLVERAVVARQRRQRHVLRDAGGQIALAGRDDSHGA